MYIRTHVHSHGHLWMGKCTWIHVLPSCTCSACYGAESGGHNRADRVIIRGEKHFTTYGAGKKATRAYGHGHTQGTPTIPATSLPLSSIRGSANAARISGGTLVGGSCLVSLCVKERESGRSILQRGTETMIVVSVVGSWPVERQDLVGKPRRATE